MRHISAYDMQAMRHISAYNFKLWHMCIFYHSQVISNYPSPFMVVQTMALQSWPDYILQSGQGVSLWKVRKFKWTLQGQQTKSATSPHTFKFLIHLQIPRIAQEPPKPQNINEKTTHICMAVFVWTKRLTPSLFASPAWLPCLAPLLPFFCFASLLACLLCFLFAKCSFCYLPCLFVSFIQKLPYKYG